MIRNSGWLQWGRDQLIAEIRLALEAYYNAIELQWGRDQLIAEMQSSSSVYLNLSTLQWGRDQLIAEILGRRCSHMASGRFNGAAIS